MRKTPLPLIIVLSLIVRPWPSVAQQGRYLYKATLVQAAPGKILEVIDLFQTISNEMKQAGTQAPLWMRHSQGDRWDLLLLFPMVRDQGAAWDRFTIGCFRDLKHYAEAADVSQKDQDAAAKAAGFESASQIGPYLRTLISLHHDTLAVAVK